MYNKSALKPIGILMLIFGLIYAAVGTLALAGVLTGALPGHETQEVMIVVLAYVVALLAILCGAFCMKGNVRASKTFGLIFAIFGLIGLVYSQVANGTYSTFDGLAMCFGVAIFYIASKIKED